MKYILLFLFSVTISSTSAQINLLKKATEKANKLIKGERQLTASEVSKGLVEALIQGSEKSVQLASVKDGFNGNTLIRIPFPEDAKKMKTTLIKAGMSNQIIKFENSLNSAAELASKKALNILIVAIQSMSINDAFAILKGNDNAATQYLKKQTSSDLHTEFKPIIITAIAKVEVTKYWNPLVKRYNSLPLTKKVNPDLEEYITAKTIEGLFVLIAQEEKNIRKNPKARVSELLQRVFN
jgi:hypothetical protein